MNPTIRRLFAAAFLTLSTVATQAATLNLDGVNSRKSSTFDGQPSVVNLLNIPRTWAWKSIVVQFNSYSGTPLDIEVTVGTATRRYKGYTVQIALPDPNAPQVQISVKNTGGSNSFDASWWLSSNYENSTVPVSGTGIPSDAVIVGQEGVPVTFTAKSAPIVLYGRPSRPHNVIHVKIESADNSALSGMITMGPTMVNLIGASKEFDIAPGAVRSMTLRFQNPTARKLKVTWTAVDKTPQALAIPQKDSALSHGFAVRYNFSQLAGAPANVVVKFDSATFPKGHAPTMTKYDVLPSSAPADTVGLTLANWDVHGELAPGKRAVVIMPIPVMLAGLPDSTVAQMIQIRHLVATTNQWETLPIDSIRNGCMYFTTSSYSWLRAAWRGVKKAASKTADVVVDYGGDIIGGAAAILGTVGDWVHDGYTWLRDGLCDYVVGPTINFVKDDVLGVPIFFSSAASDPSSSDQPGVLVVRPEADLDNFFPTSPPPQPPTSWKSIRSNPNWNPALAQIRIERTRALAPVPKVGTEEERFDSAEINARLLLDDEFLWKADQGAIKQHRRFGFSGENIIDSFHNNQAYPISGYLLFEFRWASLVARIGPLLRSCEASLNPWDPVYKIGGHVKDMAKGLFTLNGGESTCREAFGIGEELWKAVSFGDTRDCISSAKALKDWMRTQSWESKKDKAYLGAVEYLTELDLFFWMNTTQRFHLAQNMTAFVSEFAEYHDFIRILMEGNNIPIKGEFALGFHELMMGGSNPTRFKKAATFLAPRLGPNGGYAEGTGYLEYVNQTVFPLLNVAVREGWVSQTVLPAEYFKSGDWMLSLIGANGKRTSVDDAVNEVPFTAGYAAFTSQPNEIDKYIGASRPPVSARDLLSLPNMDASGFAVPRRAESEYMDGAGILRGLGLDGKWWSMSIIAENGALLDMGGGHDQQDNGAITLSNESGPGNNGILVDPGYNGFDARDATSSYETHSVMMLEGRSRLVIPNQEVSVQDAWHLLDDLGAGYGHNPWTAPTGLAMDFLWVFNPNAGWKTHGGGSATVESIFDFMHFPGFRQIMVKQSFDYFDPFYFSYFPYFGTQAQFDAFGLGHPSSVLRLPGVTDWSSVLQLPNRQFPSSARRTAIFAGGNYLVLDQAEDRQPAPQYRYDDASKDTVKHFQAFGRANETWTPRFDAVTDYPQHSGPALSLGTLSFHGSGAATTPGSVITFIPTNSAFPAHKCTNSRDVYEACVEFTGAGGLVWTVLANNYGSTTTLKYNDPIWGVATTTDRYLVRQFDPSKMETLYLTATGQNLNIDGTDLAPSTGLRITRDGSVTSTGMLPGTQLHSRMSAPLIRRMLE